MGRQTNRYIGDDGKAVWAELEQVIRFGYSPSTIFSDWIDVALNSQLALTDNMKHPDIVTRVRENRLEGKFKDDYMRIVRKYRENETRPRGERPADYFARAWGLLQAETRQKQADILPTQGVFEHLAEDFVVVHY